MDMIRKTIILHARYVDRVVITVQMLMILKGGTKLT